MKRKKFTNPGHKKDRPEKPPVAKDPQKMRLNRYLAKAGVCSRRDADKHITGGSVDVNGKTVTELGTIVNIKDEVRFKGKLLTPEEKVYILMNKPKDVITTTSDPQGRKTVMDIIGHAASQRLFPVGRLDRNSTGLLLLTNDGELTKKLTHPSYDKSKIYDVYLDKDFSQSDADRLVKGLRLEDGVQDVDGVSYPDPSDKRQIGIEIHSGKNRIIRRMMEALGYRVVKLDRVYFAGLTKKNLKRGRWRYLNRKEIAMLYMGSTKQQR